MPVWSNLELFTEKTPSTYMLLFLINTFYWEIIIAAKGGINTAFNSHLKFYGLLKSTHPLYGLKKEEN